jgi:hypothetical protein
VVVVDDDDDVIRDAVAEVCMIGYKFNLIYSCLFN